MTRAQQVVAVVDDQAEARWSFQFSCLGDVYDAKAEKIIWRGLASKTVDQKTKPDKQQKNLAKAAAKLLKNYPPPVKS
jgi:hypothetical protein